MVWKWGLVTAFFVLYVPTIGSAVNGFLLYKTADGDIEARRGKLRCIFGGVGTIIVTIIMLLVVFLSNSSEPAPVPSDPSESVNVSTNQIEIPSQDEGVMFRKKIAFDVGTYTGYVDQESKQPDGQGIMEYFNGDKYDGEWLNGQRHGNGTMIYIDGDIYDGEWQYGAKNGFGIYTWSTGETYRGSYKNDLRDGEGEYIGWTGFQTDHGGWRGNYYGTSVGDVFEGYGSFEFDNGDRFEGIFHNNEFWQGMYTYHDGTQQKIDMNQVINKP